MKLLIIAGPYEADRIRKSAVAAGFETVAVEPGESLSGWITASRPQLIVMAPQMVNPDPALALAKVRSVPRGRVPIFLVGDEADEPLMASLSEGFFVRPVSPEALLEHAKVVLAAERAREATNLGHEFGRGRGTPGMGSRPAPPPGTGSRPAPTPGMPPVGAPRPPIGLKPLVTTAASTAPSAPGLPGGSDASVLLAALDAGIDALLDAELSNALAAAPKVAGPEAEFSNQTTADMKADDIPKRKPAAPPSETNGAGAARAEDSRGAARAEDSRGAARAEDSRGAARAEDSRGAARGEDSRGTARAEDSRGTAPRSSAPAGDGRARIIARYALVEVGDYYQVLGVARDATSAELERAHARLARELSPEEIGPGLAGELGVEIAAIRIVVEEARRILGDPRLRARYSARL